MQDKKAVDDLIAFMKKQEVSEARNALQDRASFNPRTEISEDARYIAKRIVGTLWTIFVLLPVVCAIIYELLAGK
jgi:hypothetical protein